MRLETWERERAGTVDHDLCGNPDVGKNSFGVRHRDLNWSLSMVLTRCVSIGNA